MTILVSIRQPVEAWQIPDDAVARLQAHLPDHEVLHARTPAEREAGLASCDAAFTWVLHEAELARAPRLRWVHTSAVAVGTLCLDALAARGVAVSNSRGIQSTPIAEHVFALLLAMTRRLPLAFERQRQARWSQNEFGGPSLPSVLRGRTLGVVGLGSIGTEVARLGTAFGMRVVATRRDPARPAPPGVERVWGPEGLDALLAEADVVVVAAPLTGETEALLDRERLGRMKPGARLVNIARGQLVDGEALADAVAGGRLAGAALDVFAEEPLPPESPLWRTPNVIVTPHTSGFRADHWFEVVDLFARNVRRWERGAPLLWAVDPARGY
ncbi:MAG: D-2-hydroxyacid dehydrogenase [Vicinamibacterales bacterium]